MASASSSFTMPATATAATTAATAATAAATAAASLKARATPPSYKEVVLAVPPSGDTIPSAIRKWDINAQSTMSLQIAFLRDEMQTLVSMRENLKTSAVGKMATLASIREDIEFCDLNGRMKCANLLRFAERNTELALKQMEESYNQMGVSLAARLATPCPCCKAKLTLPEDDHEEDGDS